MSAAAATRGFPQKSPGTAAPRSSKEDGWTADGRGHMQAAEERSLKGKGKGKGKGKREKEK
jgi:hypothetical protein